MQRKNLDRAVWLIGLIGLFGCASAPRSTGSPIAAAEGFCQRSGIPNKPVLEAGGWINEHSPVTIWAVPRIGADEKPSSSSDQIDFYAEDGAKKIKLPWIATHSTYFGQPGFLFGNGGRMLVFEAQSSSLFDWVLRRRRMMVGEYDFTTQKLARLRVLREMRKYNFSDLAVSPAVNYIAWATKNGLAVANIRKRRIERHLKGNRIRAPWFSTDGKLIGAWALSLSSGPNSDAQLFVLDVESGVMIFQGKPAITSDSIQAASPNSIVHLTTRTMTANAFQDVSYTFFQSGTRARLSSFMIYPTPNIEPRTWVLSRSTFTWAGQSYRLDSLRWDRNFCIGPVFNDNLTRVGFSQQDKLLTWTDFGSESIGGYHRTVDFEEPER